MPKLKVLDRTPAQLGYFFPPEWHPHTGTWFSWPRPEGVSFPGKYHTIPAQMAAIFREIAPREQVHVNVQNANVERIVREQLKANACPLRNIFFHHIRTNDPWCRDHGPAFVLKSGPGGKTQAAIVDWGFNAWGGKYPPYADDDAVPTRIAEELQLPVFYPRHPGARKEPPPPRPRPGHAAPSPAIPQLSLPMPPRCVIMEGGSVEFNGRGTVMATESVLLNKNRNPELSKKQIEQYVKDYYGQSHVVWLGEGIAGDDTDGHVDDLARFIAPDTVVVGVEEDPRDVNYKVLKENRRRLEKLKDQDGNPFNIIQLPMPGVVEYAGIRLPATYMNFYFVNGALLVPTYRNRKNDRKSIDILQRTMPDRKVIGIDCTQLIWGRGAIHCMSQQQPRFG